MSALVAGAIGGSSLLGGLTGYFNNERNLEYQKEAFEWNKQAQEKTWEREDNAIQRRRADLIAAGFSPVLAAGQPAQAGSPTKIDPVSSQNPFEDALKAGQGAAQAMMAAQSYETGKAQQNLLESQASLTDKNLDLADANIANKEADTLIKLKERGLYENAGGHPKYNDLWGKRGQAILDGISKIPIKKIAKSAQDFGSTYESYFPKFLQRRK